MSSTLVCDCAIHTIVFFGEFGLTSAASRQNSSEQNGRSTYCAARQAPPRSGGYSEAVYNGVWQIANLHFCPFLTVREICPHHHTPPFLLGCSPLELADNSQALIHIAFFVRFFVAPAFVATSGSTEDMGSIRSPCSLQKDVYAP